VTYSDRFIPSRAASARLNFSLLDREAAAAEPARGAEREDANPAYNLLLRSELLGGAAGACSSPERGSAAGSSSPLGRCAACACSWHPPLPASQYVRHAPRTCPGAAGL